jgi:hypothetical protein
MIKRRWGVNPPVRGGAGRAGFLGCSGGVLGGGGGWGWGGDGDGDGRNRVFDAEVLEGIGGGRGRRGYFQVF